MQFSEAGAKLRQSATCGSQRKTKPVVGLQEVRAGSCGRYAKESIPLK
ncbi:hypothetical protein [Pontibacter actiniarum]|nr:hypothetical protein [Pontibacter actiniarum]